MSLRLVCEGLVIGGDADGMGIGCGLNVDCMWIGCELEVDMR